MNPETFLTFFFGLLGFVLFRQVISGHDSFPFKTRGKGRFANSVYALAFGIFLARTILRYSEIPQWVFVTSALGLILGIGASLLALRNPSSKKTPEYDA